MFVKVFNIQWGVPATNTTLKYISPAAKVAEGCFFYKTYYGYSWHNVSVGEVLGYEVSSTLTVEEECYLLEIPKSNFGTFEEFAQAYFTNRNSYDFCNQMAGVLFKQVNHFVEYDTAFDGFVRLFQVEGVVGDTKSVTLYKTYKDYERGRKTKMKTGRAIRWMFPELTVQQVEQIVKEYTNAFVEREYVFKIGKERNDFAHAYSDNLARSYDPATTGSRKSLHNSCMRGVEVEGMSPAEVYASGEFHIAWLEDDDGAIAGRVVVWDNPEKPDQPQAGPVYGVCEHSLNVLEKYLDSIGARRFENDSSWYGAKLLYIEVCDGDTLAPYSDMEQSASTYNGYLVLGDGNLELTSTEGYTGDRHFCSDCGDPFSEDDGLYVENTGQVCPCCAQHYIFCQDVDEYVHYSRTIEVYGCNNGRTYSENVTEDCEDIVWCDIVGQYWFFDDVTESTKYEGEFIPTHLVGNYPEMFENEEEENEEVA